MTLSAALQAALPPCPHCRFPLLRLSEGTALYCRHCFINGRIFTCLWAELPDLFAPPEEQAQASFEREALPLTFLPDEGPEHGPASNDFRAAYEQGNMIGNDAHISERRTFRSKRRAR